MTKMLCNKNITYLATDGCGLLLKESVRKVITDNCLKFVCEIGGGANSLLTEDFQKKYNLDYTLLDISQTELDKVSEQYYQSLPFSYKLHKR